ncbi:MAG: aspartate aminotransferase family protein [Spirochaetota bacterium]
MNHLREAYRERFPRSGRINQRALGSLVDGGSHSLRLIRPFPPRIARAQGARIEDEEGNRILDFWQGHFANILGHNPPAITSGLAWMFASGAGLQTGFADRLQVEAAELLCRCTGSERVRFTTSGTLATMYAVLLARAYTGRELVVKAGGGWHGAHPWGLKGIGFQLDGDSGGFENVESAGLGSSAMEEVVVTRYNDPGLLADQFRRLGDRAACLIVEPFMGAGGFIPADIEYLQAARELTSRHGSLLIFDEIISGFRFRAGDAGTLYGVRPDLATFGKIMGGGMPVSAVGGRARVMKLLEKESSRFVRFSGGTYAAHPSSLLAARDCMRHLVEHEEEIYPAIGRLGEQARKTLEAAFTREGIPARCTGYGNEAVPESSLGMLVFPRDGQAVFRRPEDVHDPRRCDTLLAGEGLQLAFLLENIHVVRGFGSVSTAHTEADIRLLGEAAGRVASLFRKLR